MSIFTRHQKKIDQQNAAMPEPMRAVLNTPKQASISLDEFRAKLNEETSHIASTLQAYAAAERAGISRSDFALLYPKLIQTIHEEIEQAKKTH